MPAMPQGQNRIAILYDQNAKFSPSNKAAIALFAEAANLHGLDSVVIGRNDASTLQDCRGLFVRDTTHPADYTFDTVLHAEVLGLPVIDSSEDILKGCNKFWQMEAFKQYGIPHPESYIIAKESFLHVAGRLTYPVVIKKHDACFSQGVYLAKNREEFLKECSKLFRQPIRCLLVQEFIKSDFDWRLCFFQKKLLFACQYFMVDGDWKIVKYDRQGKHTFGKHLAVAESLVPYDVMTAGQNCLEFLGNGLWGVDIKQTAKGVYVIETNDNPSIDHGVEDSLEGMNIYSTIMKYFTGL